MYKRRGACHKRKNNWYFSVDLQHRRDLVMLWLVCDKAVVFNEGKIKIRAPSSAGMLNILKYFLLSFKKKQLKLQLGTTEPRGDKQVPTSYYLCSVVSSGRNVDARWKACVQVRKFSWNRHGPRLWVIQVKSHFEMGVRCVTWKGKKMECRVVWEQLGGCQIFQKGVEVGGSHPFISSLSFLAYFLPLPAAVLEPISPPHEQQPPPNHPISIPSISWAAAKWEGRGTTLYQREH